MRFKVVSKDEFERFVTTFPRPLERDVSGISDPPTVTFNDFSDGKVWPESVVARYHDDEVRDGLPNTYYIRDM